MISQIAFDLFNLFFSGLVLWGFGWLCYHCAQTPPKPQSYRKRRQR